MKFRNVFWLLCFWGTVDALITDDISDCGKTCLVQAASQAGCLPSNTTCLCGSQTFLALTLACTDANCTMHDTLAVAKVQADACHLRPNDVSGLILALTFASLFFTSSVVILRLISKGSNQSNFKADDFIVTAALLLSIPPVVCAIKITLKGFGKHAWQLNDGDLLYITKYFYVGEVFYVFVLGLTKFSILFLYLQIFVAYPRFQHFAIALGIYIIVGTSIIGLLTIFQCRPLAYFWDRDLHGTCMSVGGVAYANSTVSITSDIFLIFLPMPVLVRLKMTLARKMEVALILSLGSFGCIVSMVRLKALRTAHFGQSTDTTHDYILPVILTAVELAVAMSCACLPEIRNLCLRVCGWRKSSVEGIILTTDGSGNPISRPRSKPRGRASTSTADGETALIVPYSSNHKLDQQRQQGHVQAGLETSKDSGSVEDFSAQASGTGGVQGRWPVTNRSRRSTSNASSTLTEGELEIHIFPGRI